MSSVTARGPIGGPTAGSPACRSADARPHVDDRPAGTAVCGGGPATGRARRSRGARDAARCGGRRVRRCGAARPRVHPAWRGPGDHAHRIALLPLLPLLAGVLAIAWWPGSPESHGWWASGSPDSRTGPWPASPSASRSSGRYRSWRAPHGVERRHRARAFVSAAWALEFVCGSWRSAGSPWPGGEGGGACLRARHFPGRADDASF